MISKAIVYGALAVFVTAAYVGIVVGLGQLIGSDRSVPLQIAATVLVAVAFQPLRERVQRFANRLVYGQSRDAVRGARALLRTGRRHVRDRRDRDRAREAHRRGDRRDARRDLARIRAARRVSRRAGRSMRPSAGSDPDGGGRPGTGRPVVHRGETLGRPRDPQGGHRPGRPRGREAARGRRWAGGTRPAERASRGGPPRVAPAARGRPRLGASQARAQHPRRRAAAARRAVGPLQHGRGPREAARR